MNLPDMTATQVAEAVKAKRTTALAVLETTLARIQARDSVLNAFTTLTAERARRKAAEVDATISAGCVDGNLVV
jgi:aspartyl-tRNA(Asn)/glutamyl-tRNA(Gln) amidotransferase subunit A